MDGFTALDCGENMIRVDWGTRENAAAIFETSSRGANRTASITAAAKNPAKITLVRDIAHDHEMQWARLPLVVTALLALFIGLYDDLHTRLSRCSDGKICATKLRQLRNGGKASLPLGHASCALRRIRGGERRVWTRSATNSSEITERKIKVALRHADDELDVLYGPPPSPWAAGRRGQDSGPTAWQEAHKRADIRLTEILHSDEGWDIGLRVVAKGPDDISSYPVDKSNTEEPFRVLVGLLWVVAGTPESFVAVRTLIARATAAAAVRGTVDGAGIPVLLEFAGLRTGEGHDMAQPWRYRNVTSSARGGS
eukprot:1372934-Amorphochlora_amoeboformis.AAC.1